MPEWAPKPVLVHAAIRRTARSRQPHVERRTGIWRMGVAKLLLSLGALLVFPAKSHPLGSGLAQRFVGAQMFQTPGEATGAQGLLVQALQW